MIASNDRPVPYPEGAELLFAYAQWIPGTLSQYINIRQRKVRPFTSPAAEVKNRYTPCINIHYLIKRHARNTYCGSGDIAPRILNLGNRLR